MITTYPTSTTATSRLTRYQMLSNQGASAVLHNPGLLSRMDNAGNRNLLNDWHLSFDDAKQAVVVDDSPYAGLSGIAFDPQSIGERSNSRSHSSRRSRGVIPT